MSGFARFVGSIFRGPRQPKQRAAPTTQPVVDTAKATADKAAAKERAEARRRAARAFGRSATILAGGLGASGTQVRKTTLGG